PEVGTLDNGELLPIVFSINCQTGWFDHETDDPADGTSTECFSEEFLRKVDGGCVCIFGASRVSYSGYNDFLCRGWYDAVWTDFDLSIGSATPMYRMGEQLNYGKWYMANHYAWGDPWGYAELTSELFHVYGDPTMEMWTAEPMSMVVSHPPSYPFGTTQITVNVSEDGAFVSLVQDGEIIGTDYSIGGDAIVDVNPLLGGVVSVTVTKHNFRPYRGSIIVPSGPHDIAVKNLNVPPTGVAGVAVNVDADIFNLGTNDEPNVEVQLLVDGFMEDSTTIPFIASGNIDPVTLSWTPMFGGNYFVEMYAIPVADENVTWNNIMNGTIFIVAYPDIWVSPGGFDFVLQAGEEDQDILTIGNSGLANLDFNIVTLQGGDSIFEDFPDLVWNPAIWDTASFTGIPEINTLGVNEPSAPNTMELDGDGDTVFSVIYDTTASDSIGFEFYYELGGGGEAPDATDGLALEYYTSGGSWIEAWSVNGDGTLHSSFDHATVDIIAADAYHGGFQYRFRSWGSGATFDDFYVDDIYFNYTVPVTDGWLQVVPETGVLPPLSSTTVDVIVNATTLSPGFHQSNITVINNDPDENPILVPVNVTVLSAPHDVAVLDMTVEGSFEAGKTLWVNGTIINQGLSDETNVDVQF
ncbi:MAG: hypothetical protein KAX31_07690, partial [Thermoplasmata archaeon]|nr:hypothetical protein [Thermoplasmata archaeon]